jgi:hypothetical protein
MNTKEFEQMEKKLNKNSLVNLLSFENQDSEKYSDKVSEYCTLKFNSDSLITISSIDIIKSFDYDIIGFFNSHNGLVICLCKEVRA